MTDLHIANALLNTFAQAHVPLIKLCEPSIVAIDDTQLIVNVPLQALTKNHLNSMYFGALAIGADVAGGFHAMYMAKQRGLTLSLAFKSFKASFLKRPEADVHFVSSQGEMIATLLDDATLSGERHHQIIDIAAYCPSQFGDEAVARFELELSIKVVD